MFGTSVYIEPKDILDKLPEDLKKRFNQCVFTDVVRDSYGGGVALHCLLFNDQDEFEESEYRYRLEI